MIIYVDMGHEHLHQTQPDVWEKLLAQRLKQKYRFEDISGQPCLIVRYDRVSPALLRALRPTALLVSSGQTDYEHYTEESLAGLQAIFHEAAWPTFCICAGYQMLVRILEGEIGPIAPPPPGAAFTYTGHETPGFKYEHGFMPVRVIRPHPLFADLPEGPTVFQTHYWEVKSLPAGFQSLAESDLCPIQAVAHPERPLFGVQFHPEAYDEAHPDGRRILENFFKYLT